ncbi:hypothetical protein UFOVP253_58 [uncultured Caudovirales phage]|uniref:Uncharacterized protein n=1 Tax=uncultured Caudovirales phage TaxID=2100421 RepID=A0A6J5LDH5_9CAUD|nr:hypothetical protein UFOVP253_58 [uncultured Caudovirales phage]
MNSLQLIFINRAPKPASAPDRRYRILVTLIRSDRPRYWNFLCHNCGSKVIELQNYDVIAEDDFYDPKNAENAAVGRHCKGLLNGGLPCQYSYFFKLG